MWGKKLLKCTLSGPKEQALSLIILDIGLVINSYRRTRYITSLTYSVSSRMAASQHQQRIRGRQPPVSDSVTLSFLRLSVIISDASIFEISYLVTNTQLSVHESNEAMFLCFWLT